MMKIARENAAPMPPITFSPSLSRKLWIEVRTMATKEIRKIGAASRFRASRRIAPSTPNQTAIAQNEILFGPVFSPGPDADDGHERKIGEESNQRCVHSSRSTSPRQGRYDDSVSLFELLFRAYAFAVEHHDSGKPPFDVQN